MARQKRPTRADKINSGVRPESYADRKARNAALRPEFEDISQHSAEDRPEGNAHQLPPNHASLRSISMQSTHGRRTVKRPILAEQGLKKLVTYAYPRAACFAEISRGTVKLPDVGFDNRKASAFLSAEKVANTWKISRHICKKVDGFEHFEPPETVYLGSDYSDYDISEMLEFWSRGADKARKIYTQKRLHVDVGYSPDATLLVHKEEWDFLLKNPSKNIGLSSSDKVPNFHCVPEDTPQGDELTPDL